ncbi:hypothetical protein H9655_20570 [Cytobacillus sp. Sa5YUA1]|uniref:Uncharacterized protein n=1 Tax=Cytobacillus stercorigallinarum TaxID=2762240 RepID=A0ABR8QV79_9BACI|nr:hypothetical protein [Cytobacillus stercorigallinarum]MBD7939440.1 hypothetical protein [Cytobacillus stercorigallinarum]
MKKIRGWKRRIKQIENLEKENKIFNFPILQNQYVDYLKMFNFQDLDKIPDWYKKKITITFINIFDSWKEYANVYNMEHFYIRLHIHEDNIFESQIMIVIENQINEYKTRFIRCPDEVKKPSWLENLSKEFTPYYSCTVWLEDELETLSETEKELMLSKLLEIRNTDSNEKEYLINDGILWCLEYDK